MHVALRRSYFRFRPILTQIKAQAQTQTSREYNSNSDKMACKMFLPLKGSDAKMPALGFGTWQAPEPELEAALEQALEAGYRHIDCAPAYMNEKAIGRVLAAWMAKGNKREDLFIVTKLPPVGVRPSGVSKYIRRSLDDLQLEYLDVYLVHTPFAFTEVPSGELHPMTPDGEIFLEMDTDHVAIWKEMEAQVDAGLTKAIGLSNFNEKQITRVLDNARIQPANLQIELHVYLQQRPLVEFCNKHGIVVTAYSPLGSRGIANLLKAMGVSRDLPDLLNNPTVMEIADKVHMTPAQVLLRYTLQRGVAAIPKSTDPGRLRQNIQVFDFQLDGDDVTKLQGLDQGVRVCDFKFFKGRDLPDLLNNPTVMEIADKVHRTPAQVLLRYTLQRGVAAIPKSTDPGRLRQNIQVFDFQLDGDDVTKLQGLDQGVRVCDFKFFKGVTKHPEFPW